MSTDAISKRAVLFADICGSTALYDNLGDDRARRLIADCLDLLISRMTACQGILVKTIGDEIMCTFSTAEQALDAASQMQKDLKQQREYQEYPMYIRIGFHYGEVIVESDDVFGDTVNVAAKVAAITRANQIMATRDAVDHLPQELAQHASQVMRADFKGKQTHHDIYLITWDFDDLQSTRIGMPLFRKQVSHLDMVLQYNGREFRVNKVCPAVVIGRGKQCDIVVRNNGLASRQHARIELRSGQFYIIDQSTNGTYVCFSDGSVLYLLREDIAIRGEGSLSLGQSYAEKPIDLVRFSVHSA